MSKPPSAHFSLVPATAPIGPSACPHALSHSHVMFHNYLRGRTRQRDRIPTRPVAVPRSNLLAPACPCSTSVNITPLQRPVVPPRGFGHTAHRRRNSLAHPHTRDSGTPVPQLSSSGPLPGTACPCGNENVWWTRHANLPVAGNPPPRFHFRENPWHSDARSSRTSHVGTRISRSTFGHP